MKKALLIDCCIRKDRSRTAKLAEAFVKVLPAEYEVTRLDVAAEDLRPFDLKSLDDRDALLAAGRTDHPRFRYAHQLAEADLAIVAAPFWDLSFPAVFKVYIEHVSVEGITFRSTAEGLQGLCRGTDLVLLTTRGGIYGDGDPLEQGTPYLRGIQQFFGFDNFRCVAADGLDIVGFDGEGSLRDACQRAADLAASL
ncbi:MAG: NAD(P)H-dependent oxidoreductase [Oscillospiraceae bacterium]|nr:NAD(P)H-dependent oxidoreductase [Oscillospiraceae bacterium]